MSLLKNTKVKYFVKKTIDTVSLSAIRHIVASNQQLQKIWELSKAVIPDFSDHFTVPVVNEEVEARIRLLIAYEALFIAQTIEPLLMMSNGDHLPHYADIGDSDGSVRLLLKEMGSDNIKTTGINLQTAAVEKMRRKGLDAMQADALDLTKQGISFDIVSVFETLEHLPDPIGFLKGIQNVVKHKLIISVPLIRKSRVGLAYTCNHWPENKKPTVENTHIFELNPGDWKKIFCHSGWKIEDESNLLMFPPDTLHRLILQPYWRILSFEGFWFVSLKKDNEISSKYVIE